MSDHSDLIGLMESIEEIPGVALAEGLKWNWETFPEYLDALEQMPRAIDVATQIPHHPLRVFVMGDRAIRREAATADDIQAMRDAVRQGLEAGAFGFTTSRTNSHKTPDRRHGARPLLRGGRAARHRLGLQGAQSRRLRHELATSTTRPRSSSG